MRAAKRTMPYTATTMMSTSTGISHAATPPRASRAGIRIGARGGRKDSRRIHQAPGAAIAAYVNNQPPTIDSVIGKLTTIAREAHRPDVEAHRRRACGPGAPALPVQRGVRLHQ